MRKLILLDYFCFLCSLLSLIILFYGVVFRCVIEAVVSGEKFDFLRASHNYPTFPVPWIARSGGCVCCCLELDCLHDAADRV